MTECSGGSDSDPGEDTLTAQDFENLIPEQCLISLQESGLCNLNVSNHISYADKRIIQN